MPTAAQLTAVRTVVVPFSAADDKAVVWAVDRFDDAGCEALVVVHPDANGVGYLDLSEIRARFEALFAGRYAVFAGHPDAPFTRPGTEPAPALHFVRVSRAAAG